MLNLDSTAFRAWLEAQPPTKRVGDAQCADSCPLANWYASYGYDATVDRYLIELYGESDDGEGEAIEFTPSEWQRAFIDIIDSGDELYRVTAAAALEILARVERMEVQP